MGRPVRLSLARHTEDDAPQLVCQFLAVFAGELFHIGHVHAGFLRDGDRQRLAGRVHGGDSFMGFDSALGEHIRLAFQPAVLVQHFQGTEQVIAAVIGKGQPVGAVVDETIFSGEIVIAAVQLGHLCLDVGTRRGGIHLQVDELLHTVPQPHQPFDAGLGGGVQVRAHHAAVFPEVYRTIDHRVGIVFHIRVSREGGVDVLALAQLRQRGFLVGAVDVLHGTVQLAGQLQPLDGDHGVVLLAVLGAFGGGPPQHHLRVVEKILIDREAFLGPAGLRPVWHNVQRPVPLLQEQNIRYHIGARIGAEGVIGQADGSQQLGPLGQIPAHGGILGVHCIAAGDERHHAARPHLIQCLGKKVVVNVETQLVVGFVVDLVIAKRDIAHSQIVKVPAVGGLEARHGDVGFGVELPGNPTADGIQLHAVQTATGHALRQHPKEVAHTAGRLQNVAGAEAHLFYRVVDGADNGGTGVVGVEGGGPGRFIFLRGQQFFQFCVLCGPCGFVRVKGVRHAAPAHILREDMLFFRGGIAIFLLDLLQCGDCFDIAPEFFLWPAFPKVIAQDAEVLRRTRFGRRRFRPVNVQSFHHHVIGQMVFVAGINGHRLGVERRCLGGGFLDGLGGFNRFFDSGITGNSRFGPFLPKAVQLTGIQPAQQGRDLIPAKIQHGQPLLIRVQHFQLDAFGRGAVVGGVAGLQLHRFHDAGVGPAQPLGDLAVGLADAQQLGKLRLIRRADQAVGQHVPQVLVRRVGVYRQKFVDGFVAGVRTQQRLEPLPALGPVDGVRHIGGQQLHRVLPQLGDLVLLVVQIDRITHMVRGCCRVRGGGGLCSRDGLPDGFIFPVRHGNVHLVCRFAAAYGEGVSLAGDGLAG